MNKSSELDISVRLLCLTAKVDSNKILTRKLNERDWAKLTRACGRLMERSSNDDVRKYWGDVFNNIFNSTYGRKNGTN